MDKTNVLVYYQVRMDSATPTNSAIPTGNITMPDNSTSIWGPIPTNPGRSLQADAIACAIITWLIACGFVGLRFYTRSRLNNVIGASDWCIIPALVCAAGVTASSLERTHHHHHTLPNESPLMPAHLLLTIGYE